MFNYFVENHYYLALALNIFFVIFLFFWNCGSPLFSLTTPAKLCRLVLNCIEIVLLVARHSHIKGFLRYWQEPYDQGCHFACRLGIYH